MVTGWSRPHGIVPVAGNDPGNLSQMNDGFSNGALEYRCDEKRGYKRHQQDYARNSRVPLKPSRHLLQVGANINTAGRLALKHNHVYYDKLTILEPVGLFLPRGNQWDLEPLAAAIAPIRGEGSAVQCVNARRNDIG